MAFWQINNGNGDIIGRDKIINLVFKIKYKYIIPFIGALFFIYIIFFNKSGGNDISVVTRNGQPAINAEVTITNKTDKDTTVIASEITDDSGSVTIKPKAILGFFERERKIEVIYGGEKFIFPYKKNGKLNNKLVIDKVKYPFRINYYNLEGAALDYLLSGKLNDGKEKGEETVIQNKGIYRNEPLEWLKEYSIRFNSKWSFQYYSYLKSKGGYFKEEEEEEFSFSEKGIEQDLQNLSKKNFLSGSGLDFNGYLGNQKIYSNMSFSNAIKIIDRFNDWVYAEKEGFKLNRDTLESMDARIRMAKLGMYRFARKRANYSDLDSIKSILYERDYYGDDKNSLKLLDYFIGRCIKYKVITSPN